MAGLGGGASGKGASLLLSPAAPPLSSAQKTRDHLHGSPMLSLNNAMGADEVVALLDRVRWMFLQNHASDDKHCNVGGTTTEEEAALRLLLQPVGVLVKLKIDNLSLSP